MAKLILLTVREGVLFLGLGAENMTDAEFRERAVSRIVDERLTDKGKK